MEKEILDHIEQIFGKMQQNLSIIDTKDDYMLIKYIEEYLLLLESLESAI